ncbi:MAG: hypothetical protein WDM96_09310 [Lacunisphaera sp.]
MTAASMGSSGRLLRLTVATPRENAAFPDSGDSFVSAMSAGPPSNGIATPATASFFKAVRRDSIRREKSDKAELREDLRRRTLEFRQRNIADVAHVLHSLGGRVEAAGREIAELREKPRSFLNSGCASGA